MTRRTQPGRLLSPWHRLLLAGLLAAASPAALAASPPVPCAQALVIHIADGEALVDLGAEQGVRSGVKGQLMSRISMTHPVTGVQIDDLVPLVGITVKSAGAHVAVIVAPEELLPRIKVGDVVRFTSLPPAELAQPEVPEVPVVECPVCEEDPEAMKVHNAWRESIGKSLAEREELWSSFVTVNPDSPYRTEAAKEVLFLRSLKSVHRGSRNKPRGGPPGVVVNHRPLRRANTDTLVVPVAIIFSDAPVQAVKLFYRNKGDKFYDHVPMHKMGDVSYRGQVPAETVRAGSFEYFIEAHGNDGQRIKVAGDVKEPIAVEVTELLRMAPESAGRSKAQGIVEWADFYLSAPGTDFFIKVEGDYLYRLKLDYLYAFRMGVGIFEGEGGPVEWVEDPDAYAAETGSDFQGSRLALTYSYFEPEFALSEYVYLIPRLVVGVIREQRDLSGTSLPAGDSFFGFHSYVRVGREQGTNLLVGGSLTQEMGVEGLVEMNLALFRYFPVGISVAATNWPVAENYAARLGLKMGWRQFDWMSIDCLLGVNMRNIRHIGMGGGAGLSFNW